MGFLGNFFNEDGDEILFFIIVFLLLFNGKIFGKPFDGAGGEDFDNGTVLFFIILFLLLFLNNDGILGSKI